MICGNCFQENIDEYGQCNACGYNNAKNKEEYPLALPIGSILYGRYIVGKVLGQGGYGITYLAQDYQTKDYHAGKDSDESRYTDYVLMYDPYVLRTTRKGAATLFAKGKNHSTTAMPRPSTTPMRKPAAVSSTVISI